ncbi:hypothetical protein DSO57_1002814 [Entomophthora muscae]|uniref:Uncharacterized protein n=1 Tax=Entomophthora muscae TaxID=34485 RepID=A0ACC2SAH2_9FUNG|nr:hypothetical protein DSO57_1002814 [Entomophthora muscae]
MELPKLIKRIDLNHNQIEENHVNLERLSKSQRAVQEKNGVLFDRKDSHIEKLEDKLHTANQTINDLVQEQYPVVTRTSGTATLVVSVVNATIHHVPISPLLVNFEDKSLSFAFVL